MEIMDELILEQYPLFTTFTIIMLSGVAVGATLIVIATLKRKQFASRPYLILQLVGWIIMILSGALVIYGAIQDANTEIAEKGTKIADWAKTTYGLELTDAEGGALYENSLEIADEVSIEINGKPTVVTLTLKDGKYILTQDSELERK